MEGNSWENGMPFSKYRHLSERIVQQPNIVKNQEHVTRYPSKNNFQSPSYGRNRSRYEDNVNYPSYNRNRSSYDDNVHCTRSYGHSNNRNMKSNYYRHREFPYKRHEGRQYFQHSRYPTDNSVDSQLYEKDPELSMYSKSMTDSLPIPESPQEAKTLKLINAVRSQKGISGLLVFLQTLGDNAPTILQNAVQSIKNGILSVTSGKELQSYELRINGELIVSGEFINKQAAKNGLCELALNRFKETCFFIVKKRNYEEISTEDINKQQAEAPSSNKMEGSKAHMMMLKMGWGGKGLGINEQGKEKTVAETMTQHVAKEGLGGKSIMTKISNILKEFALSNKVTTLAFDSGFTKEERAEIHSLAAKLNLKSKSEGNEENRRITIRKKIARWDLVKELLLANCENEAYNLTVPSNFADIWAN